MRLAFIKKWINKKEISWRKSLTYIVVESIVGRYNNSSLVEFRFIKRCNLKLRGENWNLEIEWAWG